MFFSILGAHVLNACNESTITQCNKVVAAHTVVRAPHVWYIVYVQLETELAQKHQVVRHQLRIHARDFQSALLGTETNMYRIAAIADHKAIIDSVMFKCVAPCFAICSK